MSVRGTMELGLLNGRRCSLRVINRRAGTVDRISTAIERTLTRYLEKHLLVISHSSSQFRQFATRQRKSLPQLCHLAAH